MSEEEMRLSYNQRGWGFYQLQSTNTSLRQIGYSAGWIDACAHNAAEFAKEREQLLEKMAMMQDQYYELSGIAADVDAGNGFDIVCRKTLQRVMDTLSTSQPQVEAYLNEVRAKAFADGYHKACKEDSKIIQQLKFDHRALSAKKKED